MVRWVVGSILHGVDPLSYFSFQPVLHDWYNKGRDMCYPICGMVHIKEPLMLIGKSSLCGGSGFPFSLSEWSLTICLMPYNRRQNVLSVSLNKNISLSLSFIFFCLTPQLQQVQFIIAGDPGTAAGPQLCDSEQGQLRPAVRSRGHPGLPRPPHQQRGPAHLQPDSVGQPARLFQGSLLLHKLPLLIWCRLVSICIQLWLNVAHC